MPPFDESDIISEQVAEILQRRVAEIRSDLDWVEMDFDYGILSQKMDEPHLTAWLYEQGVEYASQEHVAGWYADGGLERVRDAVLNKASYKIGERIDGGERPTIAFNTVTNEWPHRAKAMVATNEYQTYCDGRDQEYLDDCEMFAAAEGFLDGYDLPEIEETHFADNPFRDENLSQGEAAAVLVTRFYTLEDLTEEQLDTIEQHDNYCQTVRNIPNVEAAINRSVYDAVIPDDLLSDLAVPEEWESLTPRNVETASCIACNDEIYHVVNDQGDRVWIKEDGTETDLVDLDTVTGRMWTADTDAQYYCDGCASRTEASTHYDTVIVDSEGNHTVVGIVGATVVDKTSADGHVHNSELGPAGMQVLLSLARHGNEGGENMLPVYPTDEYGESVPQEEAISAISDGNLLAPQLGPGAVVSSNLGSNPSYIVVPNNPQAIHRAKNFLEDATEYHSNESSEGSTPGLGELFG